ncbi:MAG TPA: class II fructose-bisphosphate aldolase [Jatrophihabitantaceae bacterium]|jgi:fructose-bisphosphate aldolase class II
MTLTSTADIVGDAARAGAGAGAFNVITIEHAEAIAQGADAARRKAILSVSENAARYHGGLAPIAAATLALAAAAEMPMSVHLDHATDPALVREAIALGIGSVMFDASALDYAANVAATAAVVAQCHDAGVWVEAELGEVGGKDGVHAPGARTDPGEARSFVERTGVDALAVAVGTSHAMLTRDAVLDFDLIAALRDAVPVPLVLHGSSGVPDDGLRQAVAGGIAKVNIGTQLNKAFTRAVREHLGADPKAVDPRTYLGAARTAVAGEVARLLAVLRP